MRQFNKPPKSFSSYRYAEEYAETLTLKYSPLFKNWRYHIGAFTEGNDKALELRYFIVITLNHGCDMHPYVAIDDGCCVIQMEI